MARVKSTKETSIAWRILWWLLVTIGWRLPRFAFRALGWIFGLIAGLFRKHTEPLETGDVFYRSYKWRRLRVDVLETNRQRYGMLACECCGVMEAGAYHVDHIYPRSTHPDLALDPENLQVLCAACNIGKGTTYTTNWRGGEGPELPKRRGLRRFLARS